MKKKKKNPLLFATIHMVVQFVIGLIKDKQARKEAEVEAATDEDEGEGRGRD